MREFKDSLSGVKDSLNLDESPAELPVGVSVRQDDKPTGTSAS
jgi:hypothetical protein